MDTSDFTTPMKQCIKCGKFKPATADYFRERKGRLLGRCLVCQSEYDKAYWQANREKRLTQKKRHYEEHGDEVRAQAKEWRTANPDKVKAANKAWYEANKERAAENNRLYRGANHKRISAKNKERYAEKREELLAASREWHKSNRERVREYRKAYNSAHRERINELSRESAKRRRKTDPEKVRAWGRKSSHDRRARLANASDSYTVADLEAIRKAQTDKQGRLICWRCGKPIKGKPHLDHWIPLDKEGSNGAGNLHYMHARCNLTKAAKHPNEIGRLL